jgi:hypothetical protein
MRQSLLAIALLVPGAVAATETLTIEPSDPGWWIEPQTLSLGGPLPLAAVARIGCTGFVTGPAPAFLVEHAPQAQMPIGFLEFRLGTHEPGIEPVIAVQMPNGALLCGTGSGSSLRAGAFSGTYRVWAATRAPTNAPVEGTLEISHVPLQWRR